MKLTGVIDYVLCSFGCKYIAVDQGMSVLDVADIFLSESETVAKLKAMQLAKVLPKTVVSFGPTQSRTGPTKTGPKFKAKIPIVHSTASLLSCVGQSVSEPPAFLKTAIKQRVVVAACLMDKLSDHVHSDSSSAAATPVLSSAQPLE